MRYQGRLKKWNVERGFGFLVADDSGQDIFVHISAFVRDGTLPIDGEYLSFEIEPDRDGKKKAVRDAVRATKLLHAQRHRAPPVLSGVRHKALDLAAS